jgi:pimeloyl-ACP methyl ester carboxylesterase
MINPGNPLYYHKIGDGPKTLLAFHGIGQDGLTCFKSFEEQLGGRYTIYAFDLFFHGRSTQTNSDRLFTEPDVITKAVWFEIMTRFLSENNIQRFDISGFSMGGKFTLATLEGFPDQVDQVFLIAPDGISEHPVYTLAARFALTRRLFRWCMEHPGTLLSTTNFIRKMGLIQPALVRFTEHVLNTPEKRNTVYHSWVAFRELRFNIPQLYSIAKKKGIQVYLFVGKHDKLLKPSAVKKLSDLLPENRYSVLVSGHSTLVEKVAHLLANTK